MNFYRKFIACITDTILLYLNTAGVYSVMDLRTEELTGANQASTLRGGVPRGGGGHSSTTRHSDLVTQIMITFTFHIILTLYNTVHNAQYSSV